MSSFDALGGGLEGEDEFKKQERLAARAARFNNKLPGNRYKELDRERAEERKAFVQQGLIKTGKTDLGDAVDMRGTCERMCSAYETEFREYTKEIHPFEARPDKRMDHAKAVAAYTRSDAGAGMGDAAILPSDLRTPATLVRSLDYLITEILPKQPPAPSRTDRPWLASERKALGYSAGFIRDRTRAIRKEFAMQSSWGHDESIQTFERIARWHILCLRELQEETGTNKDMHIDSAELGRCFTSLRQHYNDRREELGVEMPYPNEPEFRAYMLIFDLTNKSVSIPTAELPTVILDHPLVKIAWDIRKAAQRNFDSQKEGSKLNSELGSNLIPLFVKLLRQPHVPYLMSCLVEVRLREMRRSALRALQRTYPRLRTEPIRYGESGQVVERKMVLLETLTKILGCEEQEDEPSAWDGEDVLEVSRRPEDEAVEIVKAFGIEVYSDETGPVGAIINLGAAFNDNQDAPYPRRWKSITAKKGGASYGDVINGKAGVDIGAQTAGQASSTRAPAASALPTKSAFLSKPITQTPSPTFAFKASLSKPNPEPAFSFNAAAPAFQPTTRPVEPAQPLPIAFASPSPSVSTSQAAPAVPETGDPSTNAPFLPNFTAPSAIVSPKPLFTTPSFFSPSAEAGPSTTIKKPVSPTKNDKLASPPKQSPKSLNSSNRQRRKSLLSNSITAANVEDLRKARERVLPRVADVLIQSVVHQMLTSMTPEVSKAVKQEAAARDYVNAKARRKDFIKRCSDIVFGTILSERIKKIGRKAVWQEICRRFLVRKCVRHWKKWATRQRVMREEAARDREDIFGRLKSMGLSRSTGGGSLLGIGDEPRIASPVPERFDMSSMSDRMDEFEIDVALHQAERAKDQLFAPTTFLSSIARHIAPLLAPSTTPTTASFTSSINYYPVSIVFHTLLSTAEASGSPSTRQAESWLKSKLAIGDKDEMTVDGVTIASDLVGRYDDLPQTTYVGLIVFEVPLRTIQSRQRHENIADAQDRLTELTKTLGQGNRYLPALLFLTWENESLEDVVARLEIEEDVKMFNQVGVVSLEDSDGIDLRFTAAVKSLFPSVEEKKQIIIRIQDVLVTIQPIWQRFLQTAQLVLTQRPTDSQIALETFRSGVAVLLELLTIIKRALGSMQPSIASTFNPPRLPVFNAPEVVDNVSSAAEIIIRYLDNELFLGLDDLKLFIAPLHQSALHGHVLPIPQILQALAFFAWGEMRNQVMPLKVWKETSLDASRVYEAYLSNVVSRLETLVEEKIGKITGLMDGVADTVEIGPYPTEVNGSHTGVRTLTTPSKGSGEGNSPSLVSSFRPSLKRPRGDENCLDGPGVGESKKIIEGSSARKVESKAVKNAKLLRALAEARKAMREMEVDGNNL